MSAPGNGSWPGSGLTPVNASFWQGGEVGEGGAGVVYRAFDPKLNRDVAVKLIRTGEASPVELARFRFEAEATATLFDVITAHAFVGIVPQHFTALGEAKIVERKRPETINEPAGFHNGFV